MTRMLIIVILAQQRLNRRKHQCHTASRCDANSHVEWNGTKGSHILKNKLYIRMYIEIEVEKKLNF